MVFNLFHSNGRNSMHLFHQLPAFTTDHTVICKHHSPLTSSNNHHDWYKNRLRCQYNSTRTLKPHLTAVLIPSTPSGFSSSPDILIQYHSYLFMFLKIDTRVLSTFLAHSLRLLEQFHLILHWILSCSSPIDHQVSLSSFLCPEYRYLIGNSLTSSATLSKSSVNCSLLPGASNSALPLHTIIWLPPFNHCLCKVLPKLSRYIFAACDLFQSERELISPVLASVCC